MFSGVHSISLNLTLKGSVSLHFEQFVIGHKINLHECPFTQLQYSRAKWFCRNVCICMFKWDLIYIVPSTITDNYVGSEMKLCLKNTCGICSMPIKKHA